MEPRPCPECRPQLEWRERAGVDVDVCADHGTWFDLGELQLIADFGSAQTSSLLVAGRPGIAPSSSPQTSRSAPGVCSLQSSSSDRRGATRPCRIGVESAPEPSTRGVDCFAAIARLSAADVAVDSTGTSSREGLRFPAPPPINDAVQLGLASDGNSGSTMSPRRPPSVASLRRTLAISIERERRTRSTIRCASAPARQPWSSWRARTPITPATTR